MEDSSAASSRESETESSDTEQSEGPDDNGNPLGHEGWNGDYAMNVECSPPSDWARLIRKR